MSYRLPDFNNAANIWKAPGSVGCPVGNPNAIIACNLALGKRVNIGEYEELTMWLLMPKLTDLAGNNQVAGDHWGDLAEVPANTGRVYRVLSVDDAGAGFPNEHRIAVLQQSCEWPRPIPGGSPLPPAGPGIITIHSGFTPYVSVGGFSSWLQPITIPTYGLLVVVSMMYQDVAGAMDLTCSFSADGVHGPWTTIPRRVTEPAFMCGAVNCSMAVFSMPVGHGSNAVRMEQANANTKAAQVFVYLVQGITDTTFTVNHGHGTGTTPSIAALAANTLVPAVYLASFSVVSTSSVSGWDSPFTLASANINTAYLAVTVTGTNGVYTPGGIVMPTGALGVMTPTGWLGTMVGMQ